MGNFFFSFIFMDKQALFCVISSTTIVVFLVFLD